ncbi:MAG: SDR family oxidoreductase [Bacteroidales bacterium]|nr:SDR family oxidoreductase [Bacteroidales bacterium]
MQLKDYHILIIGGNSEIGKNNATHIIKEGGTVHFSARDINAIENLRSIYGNKHFYYQTSLSNQEEINDFIKTITIKLNGVIFATGESQLIAARMINERMLDRLIHSNFKIPVLVTKSLFKNKKLLENASLLYYTSVSYQKHFVGNTIYSSAKIALSNYVKSLATELIYTKIRVNSIAPGFVFTKSYLKFDNEYIKLLKNHHPRGFTSPDEVSKVCIFLLSEASSGIHGQEIIIDGGYSIKL